MNQHCAICPRTLPAGTGRYACAACEHRLRYELTELAGRELAALRAELAPGASPAAGSRSGGRAHAPLPLDIRVLDLLGPGTPNTLPDPYGEQSAGIPLGPILTGWAHTIAIEHQAAYRRDGTTYLVPCTSAAPRTGTGLDAWCRWLIAYLPHAVRRPWITEMNAELTDAMHRVRQITGTRTRTRPRAAPCPACGAIAMSRTDGVWEVACEACGHRMDPADYDAHAAAVLPGLTLIMARLATPPPPAGPEQPTDEQGAA